VSVEVTNVDEYWFDDLSPLEKEWLEAYIKDNLDGAAAVSERGAGGYNLTFNGPITGTSTTVGKKLKVLVEALEATLGVNYALVVRIGSTVVKFFDGKVFTAKTETKEVVTGEWTEVA
jgi:hypothetical protein